MTAEISSADTDTSHNLCLITHANLPQLDPRLEHGSQILDQLPEVYPSFRSKIKQYFIIIKCIFTVDQFHLKLMLTRYLRVSGRRLCSFSDCSGESFHPLPWRCGEPVSEWK